MNSREKRVKKCYYTEKEAMQTIFHLHQKTGFLYESYFCSESKKWHLTTIGTIVDGVLWIFKENSASYKESFKEKFWNTQ